MEIERSSRFGTVKHAILAISLLVFALVSVGLFVRPQWHTGMCMVALSLTVMVILTRDWTAVTLVLFCVVLLLGFKFNTRRLLRLCDGCPRKTWKLEAPMDRSTSSKHSGANRQFAGYADLTLAWNGT